MRLYPTDFAVQTLRDNRDRLSLAHRRLLRTIESRLQRVGHLPESEIILAQISDAASEYLEPVRTLPVGFEQIAAGLFENSGNDTPENSLKMAAV